MKNCVFCKIVNGELPCAKIYEDENLLAFLDIHPVTLGHTLIIPRKHFQMMTDTPDAILKDIFSKSKRLMRGIQKALSADFVALSIVGVDVPHFHIHLIPRKRNDGLANFWPTSVYPKGEMERYASMIQRSL